MMPSLYMVQVPLPIVPKCLYQQVFPLEAVAVSAIDPVVRASRPHREENNHWRVEGTDQFSE